MVLAMVLADVGTAVAAMVAVVRAAAARKMAGEEVATAGMATAVVAVADSASTPCTQHIHILRYYRDRGGHYEFEYVLCFQFNGIIDQCYALIRSVLNWIQSNHTCRNANHYTCVTHL